MPQGSGEFAQLVLLAVLHVKGEAYGVSLEPEGAGPLRESRRAVDRMWDDLDPATVESGT